MKRRREEICAYYAWHAPSTPVPMLLRRAQRLVGADFLALMKRLAPAGIDALQRVTGPPEKAGPLKRAARQTHLSRWCPPGRASRTAVAPNQTEHAERRPALANKVAQRAKLCTKNAGHAMPSADHQRCRRRATPACGALCAGRGGHLSRHSRNATTPTNRRSKTKPLRVGTCSRSTNPHSRVPNHQLYSFQYTLLTLSFSASVCPS